MSFSGFLSNGLRGLAAPAPVAPSSDGGFDWALALSALGGALSNDGGAGVGGLVNMRRQKKKDALEQRAFDLENAQKQGEWDREQQTWKAMQDYAASHPNFLPSDLGNVAMYEDPNQFVSSGTGWLKTSNDMSNDNRRTGSGIAVDQAQIANYYSTIADRGKRLNFDIGQGTPEEQLAALQQSINTQQPAPAPVAPSAPQDFSGIAGMSDFKPGAKAPLPGMVGKAYGAPPPAPTPAPPPAAAPDPYDNPDVIAKLQPLYTRIYGKPAKAGYRYGKGGVEVPNVSAGEELRGMDLPALAQAADMNEKAFGDAVDNYVHGKQFPTRMSETQKTAIINGAGLKYADQDIAGMQQGYAASGKFINGLQSTSPTSPGGMARMTNVAYKHLSALDEMMSAQQNGDIPLLNSIVNGYRSMTGDGRVVSAQLAATIASGEVLKQILGSGAGSLEDRKHLQDLASTDMGPDQQAEFVATAKRMMGEQAKGLYQQAKQAGPDAESRYLQIIGPDVAKTYGLAGDGGGSGPKVGTVDSGYRFKGGDPADPANWEKAN